MKSYIIKFVLTSLPLSIALSTNYLSALNEEKPNQLLLKSASSGNVEGLKTAIEQGAEFHVRNRHGQTAFDLAIEGKHLEAVQWLMSLGIKREAIGEIDIFVALNLILREADLKIIGETIKKGDKVNQLDKYGLAPLHYVSYKGDLEFLKRLLLLGADVNVKDSHNRKTPLYYALSVERIDSAIELVLAGADVNEADDYGRTVFNYVLERGDLDQVRPLLEKGADINTRNLLRETTLHLAVQKSPESDIISYLLEKGANANARNLLGETPLHLASDREDLEKMRALIKGGARVNAKNRFGETALHLVDGREALELLLSSSGIEINARNKYDETVLSIAIEERDWEKAVFFIERGADINARDKKGWTLLRYALKEGDLEKADFLIENGANVNMRDKNNRTLLYYALKKGSLKQVIFLIERGADLSVKDDWGQTALHYASKKGFFIKLKALVEGGADLNIKDDEGKLAFDLAKSVSVKEYLALQMSSSCRDSFKLN
ncbi:MAG: ankyrin repeat domain-containing protein [Oligoflexia bacterium]|nr:ankyrin repeat domain-containing protein [Oligoflexia bacterium]